MNEWISIDDREPDDSQEVLGWIRGEVLGGFWRAYIGQLDVYGHFDTGITHWMDVPDAPERV